MRSSRLNLGCEILRLVTLFVHIDEISSFLLDSKSPGPTGKSAISSGSVSPLVITDQFS